MPYTDDDLEIPSFLDRRLKNSTNAVNGNIPSDKGDIPSFETSILPLVSHALKYVGFGWPVLPLHGTHDGNCTCGNSECTSPGKHPRTQHGVKDASLDPEQIEKWWGQWPDANIGIATGEASDLLVLDIDPRNGGDKSLIDLQSENGALPKTLTVNSGGGGQHLYFRYTGGKIGWLQGAPGGIDLKADGGYVVAPPSIHASGMGYAFDHALDPSLIAEVPNWLREMICRPEGDKAPAHEGEMLVSLDELNIQEKHKQTIRDGVPEGRQSEALFGVIRALVKAGYNDTEISKVLLDNSNGLSRKPLAKGAIWLDGEIERARLKPDINEGPTSSKPTASIKVERLSDVQPEEIDWLWKPYIPVGKLTSIEGDPGIGKSFLTSAIAAMISLGSIPPAGEASSVPGRVLMLSAEDGLADTLRPRLDTLGADVDLIFASETAITLLDEGLRALEFEIEHHRPRLVVIDPLVAFMGGKININQANQVRELMAGLANLASRTNTAILVVRHLAKGERNQAIYRGLGSIDITAACRSVIMVGSDPDDDTRRFVAHAKSNLAAFGPSISYTINDGNFVWGGVVKLTSEDLNRKKADPEEQSALDEAKDFLKEFLRDGPQPSTKCFEAAKGEGIANSTLKRAKKQLGIVSKKEGDAWAWHLKDEVQDV